MQTCRTFEDVSIVHSGSVACSSLFTILSKQLRDVRVRSLLVNWIAREDAESNYVYSINPTRIIRTERDQWEYPLHSQQQLTDSVNYFQLKINFLSTSLGNYVGSGIFIGVSKNNNTTMFEYAQPEKTICMYNDQAKLDENSVTRIDQKCKAGTGDVIGVVVDFLKDNILFYINGHVAAVGKQKPSVMRPVYAVLWLYYNGCDIEVGEFIPYTNL